MMQEAPQSRYEEAFVDVAGARVYCLQAGSGRPMLLVHGLLGSSQNWRHNIDALAQHATVYAIDLVNMGKSQRVGGLDPGLQATANRIIAVMDALGLPEADLVAHSHGGAVALMLAALHPARVRRLILFAPANPYCRSGDQIVRTYSTRWGGYLAWLLPYSPTPIQRIALGELYGRPGGIVDSCLHEIVQVLRNPDTLRHILCTIRCWFSERAKLKAALGRIKRIPILLVWGDQDCTVSMSSAVKMNRKLSGSELIVLPGGHAVFEETPEQANSIMLEWLGRHPSPIMQKHDMPQAVSLARRSRSTTAIRHLSPGA
jgi:4,5:9,10-diseco-3-hydroxy-5,9,17-trioxoandrosta-1(10),2-diene-4-oate hydrolase